MQLTVAAVVIASATASTLVRADASATSSLWTSSSVPTVISANDAKSVELGLKFQPSVAGQINGVRFYKSTQNVGTHVGDLWDANGNLLATATFTNESTSGWQEVDFAQPVPVVANTTYVVSYFAPAGHYSYTYNYFTSAYTNGDLTALANTTSSPNGLYGYASSHTFPKASYQASNYWVDAVFSAAPPVPSYQPPAFPDASTTGPADSSTLAQWTGDMSGYERMSDLDVENQVLPTPTAGFWTFTGSNLIFRNCVINGGVVFKGSNIDIENCDIPGGVSFAGTAGVTMANNNVHDFTDGIHITSYPVAASNIKISGNYVHNPTPACGSHADAVQLLGVEGLTVTGNTLDMGPWFQVCGQDALNSVFQIESTQGPNDNLNISNNYVNGAGYTARFYSCTNTTFTDNYFGRDYHYGPVINDDDACFVNKSGNVWYDNDAPLTF